MVLKVLALITAYLFCAYFYINLIRVGASSDYDDEDEKF